MDPPVPNYGEPGRGPVLAEGMALAIEPMLTLGQPDARLLDDGWTVVTADGILRGALRAHRGDHGGRALGADGAGRRPRRARPAGGLPAARPAGMPLPSGSRSDG